MSVAPRVASREKLTATAETSFKGLQWWHYGLMGVYLLVAALLVVPLVRLGSWMMGNEYYHHMPLLLLAAVGAGIWSARQHPFSFVGAASPRVLVWSAVSLVMTAGVYVLPSRWMAAPAAFALVVAVLYFCGGRALVGVLRSSIILLFACVPLPVHIDTKFVLAMQQLATTLASLWLDVVGVMHLATGVDIRTAAHSYVVEDACSGIHSMFAAIAVGIVYGVVRNYRLLRIVALVGQMVFWVVIANAIRVFLVVYGQDRWGTDLSTGAPHETLGMVTFAVGILLALSGDHIWRYVSPNGKQFSVEEMLANSQEPGWLDRPVPMWLVVGVIGILGVVSLSSIALYSRFSRINVNRLSVSELTLRSAIKFDAVSEDFFPMEMAGWKRVGFRVEETSESSVFGGLRSFIWQYGNGSRTVLVSLDGPYPEWHNLADCYTAVGWNVERDQYSAPINGAEFDIAELTLERPPFDLGKVLFACVYADGSCVSPPADFLAKGFGFFGLNERYGNHEDPVVGGSGVVQLQILDLTPVELTEEQFNQNKKLFSAAAEHAFSRESESP